MKFAGKHTRRILNHRVDDGKKTISRFEATFVLLDQSAGETLYEPLLIDAISEHVAWTKAIIQFGNQYPTVDISKVEVRICSA